MTRSLPRPTDGVQEKTGAGRARTVFTTFGTTHETEDGLWVLLPPLGVASGGAVPVAQAAGGAQAVSAGGYHTCGIKTDETVACWGSNYSGQLNAPTGTFSQISAGLEYTCGIRTDETVACWGSNNDGRLGAAPSISTQPQPATVTVGQPFSLSVTASGTPAVSYQWSQGGSSIPGATGSSYSVSSVSAADAGSYTVAVSNLEGSVTSTPASITVNGCPAISVGASGVTGTVLAATYGSAVSQSFTASDSATTSWSEHGVLPNGLSFDTAAGTLSGTPTQLGTFSLTITASDANGCAGSQTFTLTVGPAALTITADPQSMTYGGTVPSFTWKGSGWVNGDSDSTLSASGNTAPSCGANDHGTPAQPVSASTSVGSYDITCSGAADANYSISFTTGTLTIAPASTTVTVAQPAGLTYGQTSATLSATVTAVAPSTATVNEGTVTFQLTQNGTNAGTAVTLPMNNGSTGNTTYTLPSGAVGSYTVNATYNPAASAPNFLGSSDSSQKVSVTYAFSGFLQPINDPNYPAVCGSPCPMSVFKAGSTVPVKVQLKDANGAVVQAGSLHLFSVTPLQTCAAGAVDKTASTATADTGTTYHWDSTGQQYIYNYKSPSASSGMCQYIQATLDDGSTQQVYIGYK